MESTFIPGRTPCLECFFSRDAGQKALIGIIGPVPGSSTLSALIHHFKEYDGDLIVEHNGRFVYPQKYAETAVRQGDAIEFINPNNGG